MINATLNVNNLPNMTDKTGYMVVINDHGKLWYYGLYETLERAEQAIEETGREDLFIAKI